MNDTKIRNDPELDNFLRRTHEIDNERKQKRNNGPPALKPKPRLTSQRNQFNESDLKEARKILHGSDMIEFNEEMVVDGSEYNDNGEDDLTFKSAYNYEKTFSPKKKNYSLDKLDLERDETREYLPPRKSQNEDDSMSFSVSKEDFLLLQRLKKDKELSKGVKPRQEIPPKVTSSSSETPGKDAFSPRKKTMPTRGKPRANNVKIQYDVDIDMDTPSLPPRRSRRETRGPESRDDEDDEDNDVYIRRFNRIHDERNSSPPPQLPTRPNGNRSYIHEYKNDDGDSGDEMDKPSLPSRAHARSTKIPEQEIKILPPAIKSKPVLNKPRIPVMTSELNEKEEQDTIKNIAPEPMSAIELIDEEAYLISLSESNTPPSMDTVSVKSIKPANKSLKSPITNSIRSTNSSLSPVPPTSRKSNDTTTFLDSLSQNKLSETHGKLPDTPKKKAQLQGLDYLDSVQMKSPSPQVSPSNSQTPSPIKTRISKLPRSESFINSALNSNLKSAKKVGPPVVKDKPTLPSKPQKFTNDHINSSSDSKNEEKEASLKSFKIGKDQKDSSVTKIPPKVPIKNNKIKLPILKPIQNKSPATKAQKSVENEHKLELPKLRSIDKNQPDSIDEGKKSNRPDVPKRKPTIPEALVNAKSLKKTNIDNSDPNSKDFSTSIPEALMKKNNLTRAKIAPAVPERKISLPEALKRVNQLKSQSNESKAPQNPSKQPINVQLETVMALHQRKTFNGSNSPSQPTPMRRTRTTLSTPSKSTPLVHVTKARAKGPKRKLPSKI